MQAQRLRVVLGAALVMVFAAGQAAAATDPTAPGAGAAQARPANLVARNGHAVGLGPVVTSALGGRIFGWDINENGSDGLLAESPSVEMSAVETFDQRKAKISKVVAKQRSATGDHELVVTSIVANDVGIVDDERVNNRGRDDRYHLMAPVTGGMFNGSWNPPHKFDLIIQSVADQQTNPVVAIVADRETKQGATPEFLTSDVVENQFDTSLQFPDGQIWYGPQIVAQDTSMNVAVVGAQDFSSNLSDFIQFDLTSGQVTTFPSVNGWGAFEGLAIDSTTDMMCTATSADYSVQFYNLKTQQGFSEPLPGAGGELQTGAAIAADPVNHVFLVSQPNSSVSPSGGSTIYVYGESGNLLETINGFEFSNADSALLERVEVNGNTRTGYVNGPGTNQLQSFTY